MRFGELFEYHKIPEWYNMYLDYNSLKMQIEIFKDGCKLYKSFKKANKADANRIQDGPNPDYQIDHHIEASTARHRRQTNLTNFQIGYMIKLPGYYYLSVEKCALVSLNDAILRALIADAIEKAQKFGLIYLPQRSNTNEVVKSVSYPDDKLNVNQRETTEFLKNKTPMLEGGVSILSDPEKYSQDHEHFNSPDIKKRNDSL